MSDELPERWDYQSGFTNGYGAALTALRRQLEGGVRWRFALDAMKEYWFALALWADEGDGEYPPSPDGSGKE